MPHEYIINYFTDIFTEGNEHYKAIKSAIKVLRYRYLLSLKFILIYVGGL